MDILARFMNNEEMFPKTEDETLEEMFAQNNTMGGIERYKAPVGNKPNGPVGN